jgi:hypothetical protein
MSRVKLAVLVTVCEDEVLLTSDSDALRETSNEADSVMEVELVRDLLSISAE